MAKSGSKVALGAKLILAVLTRDSFTCCYCAATGVSLTIDHVRPRSWFPKSASAKVVNSPSNLCAACANCNSVLKGGLDLVSYARKLRACGKSPKAVAAMVRRVRAAQRRKIK